MIWVCIMVMFLSASIIMNALNLGGLRGRVYSLENRINRLSTDFDKDRIAVWRVNELEAQIAILEARAADLTAKSQASDGEVSPWHEKP